MNELIFGFKNKKNNRIFLMLEDGLGTKMKVIDPDGQIKLLEESLFDEDAIESGIDQLQDYFNAAQIAAFQKYTQQQKTLQQKSQLEEQQRKQVIQQADAWRFSHPEKIKEKEPRTPSLSSQPSNRKKKPVVKRPPKEIRYRAGVLAFYRHHIEPLIEKDTIVIEVDGLGIFRMTKGEFESDFNDVLFSKEYKRDGAYYFDGVPERAKKFLTS